MHDHGTLQDREQMIPPTSGTVVPVVRDLLDRLDAAGIAYCHWKSNEHLDAAVAGLTDLDVLVGRGHADELQAVLAASGYRRFAAVRAYPAIEDYLALDRITGRLIHFHLHHELTLGEPHLKGYRLPWAHRLLAGRQLDGVHGVYVAEPAIELLLLLTRAALKQRWRDRMRGWGGRPAVGLDMRREYAWLRARAAPGEVAALAAELLHTVAAERLAALLDQPWDDRRFHAFASAARHALRSHRSFGASAALLRRWAREGLWLADGVNRRYLHRSVPLRRVSPRGGVVVALLGADGSGKSTLVAMLAHWLATKLDVVPIYFGSGDGPSSLYRLPMHLVARRLRAPIADGAPASAAKRGGLLRQLGWVPWAVALAVEKQTRFRGMVRARNRGMVVLCDRYPQNQVPGFNDGPLLGAWMTAPWRFKRALAQWEASVYAAGTQVVPPDLVIKLIVTPAMAVTRKPEMTTTEVTRRVAAIRSFRFPSSTLVVELDADRPLQEVAAAVREHVWEFL
jgi:energy-coupling factor transporter ATP-binding protein EcfA2